MIFDDVLEDCDKLRGYHLFDKFGLNYLNEAYYLLKSEYKPNLELLDECLRASDANWYCLCLLSSANLNDLENRELDISTIQNICQKASIVVTSAYDGEGYIFWRRYSS